MQIAGVDFLGESHSPVHILGKDTGGQSEPGIVGHGDSLVNVVKGTHGYRRPEQLLSGNTHIRLYVGHYCRRMDSALLIAASHNPGALSHSFADPLTDPGSIRFANHRPHPDRLVEGVSGSESLCRNLNRIQEVGINPPVGQYPLSGNADLPGIGEAAGYGSRRHSFDVGVGHYNQRAV